MLVINVDSGEYVLGEDVNGDDDLEVDLRALALYPNAGLFGMRIGYPASDAAGAVFRPTQEADGAR